MSSTKSRKDTRAVVSLVARYRSPATFEYVQEACCDVSAGGMFIKSGSPAAAGTLLKLECEVSDAESAKIRGVGRVVWLRSAQNEHGPAGMGVKFVKLEPGSKELILDLIKRLEAAGIEARSISAAPEMAAQALANPEALRGLTSAKSAGTSQPTIRSSIPTATVSRSSMPTVTRTAGGTAPGGKIPSDPAAKIGRAPNGFGSSVPPQPLGALSPSREPGKVEKPSVSHETTAASAESSPSERSRDAEAQPIETSAARPAKDEPGKVADHSGPTKSVESASQVEPRSRAERGAANQDEGDRSEISRPVVIPRRGGALKVWLGIAAAVAVLVAIIFADESSDSSQARSGSASNDSTQVRATNITDSTRADPAPTATDTPTSADPAHTDPSASPMQPSNPEAPPTAATGVQTVATDEPVHAAPTPEKTNAPTEPAATVAARTEPTPASTENAKPHSDATAPAKPIEPAPTTHAPIAASDHPAAPPPPSAAETKPAQGNGPYVIEFVTRPVGATVSVGELSVVAPGQVELGNAIPDRMKVIAKKDGFQQSSAWIDRNGFESVEGKMWRRVYMTLPPADLAAPPPTAHLH